MQHNAVDSVAGGEASFRLAHGQTEDAAHLTLGGQHVVQARRPPGQRCSSRHRRVQRSQQRLRAIALHADRLDDRHAEFTCQHDGVDRDALLLGHIGHVERDHHRQTELFGLEHQAQVQAQIGRVGHAHQQVRQGLLAAAGDDVARHGFIGAQRIQAVGTGQIEHEDAATGGRAQRSFFALDGHARVIGHLLAAARQQIEQRGLAAVGISEQRDTARLAFRGEAARPADDGFNHGGRPPA